MPKLLQYPRSHMIGLYNRSSTIPYGWPPELQQGTQYIHLFTMKRPASLINDWISSITTEF